jgi:predicted nucleic acid-binding protein
MRARPPRRSTLTILYEALPHGPGLIGDIDTLIAATALVRGLTLVTTDRAFERVPRLQLMLIPRASLRAR